MKFTALGRTKWLYDSILACTEAGHTCSLVVTAQAMPEYEVNEQHFKELADSVNADFVDVSTLSHSPASLLAGHGCDVAISVNWPVLLKADVLETFPHGVLNAHAGDLPRFRGNACPNWAILNGEKRMGLSVHLMDERLDHGPVLLKRFADIGEQTYIGDLYGFMNSNIPEMFAQALTELEQSALTPRPQPDEPGLSLRCFPRLPEDGAIDWARPARDLAALVRASSHPFAGAFCTYGDRILRIWRARAESLPYPWLGVPGQIAASHDNGEVSVLTGEGVLVIEEMETEGPKAPSSILSSLRTRLGNG